ncbi:MAG: right-handed parallel beta-helix repeat-containing protein, partial [Candidatus Zixiibacteriota bacterium]
GQHRDNLFVDGGGGGDVILLSSAKIRIRGFTVRNSGFGAGLKVHSSFSTISGNTLTDNATGVWIESSSDINEVFHNNFIDNTQSAYDECENFWDDDFPSGGNYWSDFDEPGEGAYDDNGDGIVDSPYDVPGGANQDGYPFTQPWDGTEAPVFCGDAGADGVIDIGDIVYLVNYLFKAGPAPRPAACVGDVVKDSTVDVGDIVYLMGYLYRGGPPPSQDCCSQ